MTPVTSFRLDHQAHAVSVFLLACLVALCPSLAEAQNANANQPWEIVTTADGSAPVARHETGAITIDEKIYLIGGRDPKSVDRYDPVSNTWTSLAETPFEVHHFQPVVWSGKIYVVGGFICCFPTEPSLTHIQIYDPATDIWTEGDEIPVHRQRGSAAAVIRNNKIYLVGGNTLGHSGGAVPWFDEYDPMTGTWTELPDAPNSRDHFSAVILTDKLVAAGGRQTEFPNPFDNTVAAVDLYDFALNQWSSADADIPTERAGAMVVSYGTEAIIIGGEISGNSVALGKVEAFDVISGTWRSLQSLQQGRHSGGAALLGEELHVMTGGMTKGGGNETTSHEKLELNPENEPLQDSDVDGLTDAEEVNVYSTDPADADTDDDGLEDGREIELGTDPNNADSDADGLEDGKEVNRYLSDPLNADTDADSLSDADEIQVHFTNPVLADTDTDTIADNIELVQGTDPLKSDTDDDGLDDAFELEQSMTDPLKSDTDNDGLDDAFELEQSMTDPLIADSDMDLLSDGSEVNDYGTNPLAIDTDNDELTDGEEITAGTDPLMQDSDQDGLDDGAEVNTHNTNPLLDDTDEDGALDGQEIELGFDPLDPDTDDDGEGDLEEIQNSGKKSSGSVDLLVLLGLFLIAVVRRKTRFSGACPTP